MAAPLTPEPPGRPSSVKLPRPSDGSSSTRRAATPPPDDDATALLKPSSAITRPADSEDESPTVISSARPKPGPDAQHAEGLVGRKLGHFELIESVGVGGMAAVIRARDLDLGREVALKILPPDMATDPENITRFKQEARAAARLDHENVARVYFCGEDQGLHFIAFEFVEGDNLRVLMERQGGRLPVAEALPAMIQVTAGLAHAALRGVVHRDIKPSNIIVTPDGRAKIVDMGLARNLDARAADGGLTQSGVTLGTFDYISPEQALEPRTADCRSDIYSLGCTFYHVLTGRPPVPEGTAAKKLNYHQNIAPLDPREINPAIPDELAAVLGKMMAKDPGRRYAHPDEVLGHLLAVAKKLGISPGPVSLDSEIRPNANLPLPAPPGISPLWVGVAVAALAVGLFALTGGFAGSDPLNRKPLWTDDPPKDVATKKAPAKDAPAKEGVEPIPVAGAGPREARSAAELVALLRQSAAHVKLKAGTVYDLTRPARKGEDAPEALFAGTSLVIEGDRLLDPPTVRLRAAPLDDGQTARPGSLTARAPAGSAAKARFRGVRFEVVFDEAPEADTAGVCLRNFDAVEFEDCTFVPPLKKGAPVDGPAALALIQTADDPDGAASAKLDRCYFAPGRVAVQLVRAGALELRATECCFGPQFAAVRVQSTPDADPERPAIVRLESCSALMSGGAVVEIGDGVPCLASAGWCLFSDPELPEGDRPRSFLLRQVGAAAPRTRFDGRKTDDPTAAPMPNGYQNVLAYAAGEVAYTFEECKAESVPVEDVAARTLAKDPWVEEQPVARLAGFPHQFRRAFTTDVRQEALRLGPDRNRNILGTKHVPGIRLHDEYPFGPPDAAERPAANARVWYPEFPGPDAKLPPQTYRSLDKAILDLKKGDVLLIRHDGPIEVDPAEFKKADTDVTVRPDEGCRPVLVPKPPSLKKDPALFKLYGGSLVLENLRFLLKPDRAPAVVSLPGGGSCTFRNCTVTLEEGEDLALVSLADPRGEMMMINPERWPAPKVAVENCFVRGRGRLLWVPRSRPFDLRVKGSLVVLDGALAEVDPSATDLTEAAPAQVTLERVTTYLTRNLLALHGAELKPESKGPGLLRVEVQATECLFVPAAEFAPLVLLDRVDAAEAERLFAWKDPRRNVYGYKADQDVFLAQGDGADAAKPERLDRDRWLAKWRETDASAGVVSFSVVPATRRFDGVRPGDFEVKSVSPPLPPEAPAKFGAPADALRKLPADG
jgi:serine/threonine protein kinase